MKKNSNLCFAMLLVLWMASCVPQRKYEELAGQHTKCQEENTRLKTENQDISAQINELQAKLTEAKKAIAALGTDTTSIGLSLRKYSKLHADLNKVYEKLIEQHDKLSTGNAEETRKIIAKLNAAQEEVLRKEDELKKSSRNLSDRDEKLTLLQKDLQQRELKLKELTGMLSKKDSVVNLLKNTVTAALVGFKDMGLTIQQKNGKVYVSLEERLLFKSGSITVDNKGEEAIRQIAKVLEKNPDVSVLIEGHTDNVAYTSGGAIKDNWDLSVMRATSVVRIITGHSKVDPKRLTAAGRGEFVPLESGNSAEARKKNRRIEIILSPKLDEILKVLETN